ncbi:uncharacterized protein B0H18DRAFT_619341 [Fomitopsis serialis]|uniref:uncharacterized protein n=1 Tax=Fomitopsis serialis TaxID=139415 RepID=UPI002008B033|nr:uncharacterized protein B0H18DRAFT_619341 [Neoantrodia serialis]KAH9919908.1 hypothetical protein B0H18DRAFT_619341 [Neoantrodia serialis]
MLRSADDLRRLVNSLPRLAYALKGVDVKQSTFAVERGTVDRARVRELNIGFHPSCTPLLSLCTAYTSVTLVIIDLSYFPSLAQVQRVVSAFSSLNHLRLEYVHKSSMNTNSADDDMWPPASSITLAADAYWHSKTLVLSLATFQIDGLPSVQIEAVLRWLVATRSSSTIEELEIGFRDAPTESVQSTVADLPQRLGRKLVRFRCGRLGVSKADVAFAEYLPPLEYSIGLRTLQLHTRVSDDSKTLRKTRTTILTVLSRIQTPYLEKLVLGFTLDFGLSATSTACDEPNAAEIDPAALEITHSILARRVFANLSPQGVYIRFYAPDEAMRVISEVITTIMPKLFAPWFARRLVVMKTPDEISIPYTE